MLILLKDVVSLIKMDPLRTDLLVASEEVDQWYAENHFEYSFDNVVLFASSKNFNVSFNSFSQTKFFYFSYK